MYVKVIAHPFSSKVRLMAERHHYTEVCTTVIYAMILTFLVLFMFKVTAQSLTKTLFFFIYDQDMSFI